MPPTLEEVAALEAERAQEWRAQYSRWQGGPTSFGPRGRIGATAFLAWVALCSYVAGAQLFCLMWMLVSVLALQNIWKLERQPPPIAPEPLEPSRRDTPESET